MTIVFACITACLLSLVLTYPIRKYVAPKLGFMDEPRDSRRMHNVAIPLIGGIGIYIAFSLSAVVFEYAKTALPYIIGGGVVAICGLIDDRASLKPAYKLLFQMASGVILCLFDVTVKHICVFGYHLELGILSYPLTVLWVMAVTNAFNLIDGLDGLCSGITVIAAGGISLVAVVKGFDGAFVCALILMCAALGFLPHNIFPAKIFLGDTGSMLLGFIVSSLCIDVIYTGPAHVPSMVAIILVGVPVFDTTYAIIRRLRGGQNVMCGDKDHIHHVLCRRYSHSKAVVLIYMASLICVGIALVMSGGYIGEAIGYGLTALSVALGIVLFVIKKDKKEAPEGEVVNTHLAENNSETDE